MGAEGGPQLAAAIKAEKSRCPTTKIFVSGYSQGAMVVHDAFKHNITSTDVEGAVLFSDPMKAQEVGDLAADKVKEICTTTDAVCAEEDASTDGPTSYEGAGEEAADWVIAAAGLA
jgi:cutinase